MSAPQQAQECCICLQPAQTRNGFEFLTTPGCCGKWFHQSCLSDYIRTGGRDCPHCRQNFPAGAIAAFAQPGPVPPTPAPFPTPQIAPFAPGGGGLFPPPQAPVFPPPAPFQQQQATFGFGGRSQRNRGGGRNLDPSFLQEDPVAPAAVPESPATPLVVTEPVKPGKVDPSAEQAADPINITLTPEYPVESLAANNRFHVRVSVQYNDVSAATDAIGKAVAMEVEGDATTVAAATPDRAPLDVVCVIDNSGSMQGEKIENLKKAIEFVISVLEPRDRLSIVTFNSTATILMNLKAMTGDMKGKVRTQVLPAIYADGGTDIYDGLKKGHDVLKNRTLGRNDNSVMFLLTDGQDRSHLAEKKAIVREMRANSNTALFVFGFGADHDSAHMIEIANAVDGGSFIYIDTNDTVIDAFGGAIGSQQGQVLRNITVNLSALSQGMKIETIQSGSYRHTIDNTMQHMHGTVTFSDLFQGEKRDFLLTLSLPAVLTETIPYPLLGASASYDQQQANRGSSSGPTVIRNTTQRELINIARLTDNNPEYIRLHVRHILVDGDIYRVRCTDILQQAIQFADRNQFAEAKKVLQDAMTSLSTESLSYKQGDNLVLKGLMADLQDCLTRMTSREEYERRGGRATCSEHFDSYSKQRKVFSKTPSLVSPYQTVSSMSAQSTAMRSKTMNYAPPPQPVTAPVVPPPAVQQQHPMSAPPGPQRASSTSGATGFFGSLFGAGKKEGEK